MKKNSFLTVSLAGLIILSLYSCSSSESSSGKSITARKVTTAKKKSEPSDFVNPFIGTQYFGHTFPGASLPYAMVHVSPDCNTTGWTYAAGYAWQDNTIMGFSHTHFSGVGMTSGGDILFQPTVNNRL